MYYHIVLELGEKFHKDIWDKIEIMTDISELDEVKLKFTEPYQLGNPILINGRTLPIDKIERLRVFSSDEKSEVLKETQRRHSEARRRASNFVVIGGYSNHLESAILKEKEITDELILYPKGTKQNTIISTDAIASIPTKVFIVHGHDDALINEVKVFLALQSIEPVILREQHDGSLTIIEKLEKYAQDPSIGFGIVLYTPDDEGKAVGEVHLKRRARQNVVFEHGLLIGLYSRHRVTCLVKKEDEIELPGDISGVVYTNHSVKDWRISVAHMLNDVGYKIDYRKII